jgi:hypothetical protein
MIILEREKVYIMSKAKDNRRVVVNNAMAKAEKFSDMKSARNAFHDACEGETKSARRKAEIAYSVKVNETFKPEYESISAYFEGEGQDAFYATSYKQFMSLSDMYEFVWCYDELELFNSNTASALVTYCRKDATKVIKAVKEGLIAPSDTKEYIRENLKPLFGGKAKTVKEGTKAKASSNAEKDNMKANWAILGHFIKKNATKGGDVEKAFNELLKYYENK